ncbi:MAG: hypothetical protein HYR84_12610 [Planctomycetes bacterium]|nr:hypothetical protein [Planctomycetota bacterium]
MTPSTRQSERGAARRVNGLCRKRKLHFSRYVGAGATLAGVFTFGCAGALAEYCIQSAVGLGMLDP